MADTRMCTAALRLLLLQVLSSFVILTSFAGKQGYGGYRALAAAAVTSTSVKGGYWPGYIYTPDGNLNLNFQTHVWYAFAGINSSYACVPPLFDDYGQYKTFVATALGSNPNVKVLLSIGGGTSNASLFATMVSTAANRKVFINTSIALARQYNYNGLDLDWESPASQTEMTNLGTFFQEWNAATVAESQSSGKAKLLLTAAVYYQSTFIYEQNQSYNITAINSFLDWVNVMSYDYHGSWESQTGEHTALHDPSRPNLNTDYGVSNWLSSGLDATKLVMGLAFYGKAWVLSSLSNTNIGAPTSSYYEDISYSDIATFNTNTSVVVVQDNTTVCMYSYNTASLVWIGYDSPSTITLKVQYAKNKSVGGYFAWNLPQDDNKWSLAKAASNAWV